LVSEGAAFVVKYTKYLPPYYHSRSVPIVADSLMQASALHRNSRLCHCWQNPPFPPNARV